METKKTLIYDPSKFEKIDIVEDMFKISKKLKGTIKTSNADNKNTSYEVTSQYMSYFLKEVIRSIKESIKEGKESSLKCDGSISYKPSFLNSLQNIPKLNFIDNSFGLGKSISLNAVAKKDIPETYDKAYEIVIDTIKIQLKQIYNETKCNKDTLYHAMILSYSAATYELYSIYNLEEINNHNIRKNANYKLLKVLTEELNQLSEKDSPYNLIEKIEEIEKENHKLDKDLLSRWFKSNDIESLSNEFLKELYPNEETENIELVFRQENIEQSIVDNYYYLPSSLLTKLLKDISIYKTNNKSMPVNKNAKISEDTTLMGEYILKYELKNEEYEIWFEDVKSINKNQSVYFRKTLNFILIKANEQNYPVDIEFDLEEYMKATGYKTKDTAFRGANRNFKTLLGVRVGGEVKRNNRPIVKVISNLFRGMGISYNQCVIRCEPDYIQYLVSQYFTLLPIWTGELKTKAFDIVDYIYYLARQNTKAIRENKSFNIGFRAINNRLGQPSPEETQRHAQLIINPILDAIEEIEEVQQAAKSTNLKITPIYDHNYKNAYEFLEGYLKIDLDGDAIGYFAAINDSKEKMMEKSKEINKLKKQLATYRKKVKN